MKHVKVNRIRQCVATVLTPAATKSKIMIFKPPMTIYLFPESLANLELGFNSFGQDQNIGFNFELNLRQRWTNRLAHKN